MRMLAYLHKTFLENVRDWKILCLTLTLAPFFVYLMYGYFHAAPSSYSLIVVNEDRASDADAGAPGASGLLAAWRTLANTDGSKVLSVRAVDTMAAAEALVRSREADLLVVIPAGFTSGLRAFAANHATAPPRLINRPNTSNVRSTMAMAVSDYVAFLYAAACAKVPSPLTLDVQPVDAVTSRSEFDLYVPALLVLAIIMVLFTAAATLIKEVDKGTMTRLVLSRLTTGELLSAVTINQVLIGSVAVLLSYGAAITVGYRGQGSFAAVAVVAVIAAVSVVAIGVLMSAFMRTIFELLTVGCFPFFVLMFFSDCMFPLPKIPVFHLAGHVVNVSDVLPTSLAVRALNGILNNGASLGDVSFEVSGMVVLTIAYFAAGVVLFRRRHQSVR